ncbi:hypothetical protein LTR10_013285 [Elasticomyces elasticus]|uniref:NmrA-like domain-containing protein n=1 Tax=Exophiala sideris TaxID=1016849 RepID=A0ABR0J6E4_9EURO|nr:hypothetical protein LTR10_013285 [Elasticomyces elasticus]KAK5027487.1 hypothetical protein LTS07_007089 [Exophiala sideris]KAK5034809.1 hypothetical protein LTR13_005991 [Exophiala sideris]KAK5056454.1 hypothetical protein LTR69_007995 [Exophiala sideris]KAK5181055.1 hypothetical protein LTR44_006386 [Eurotiomycetes sp. CCFEE 6388]
MTLRAIPSTPSNVTLLVLGAGWTWQFLQPLLIKEKITHAATTTTGHDGTIQFKFDPDCTAIEAYKALPKAKYVLVTFPLKGKGPSARLVECYNKTHSQEVTRWIQLGSTGIFTADGWNDSSSPIDESNERGIAENELISLGGCVLNLAGLYGASRQPGNWIARVAKTKEQLAGKGALHLIHGTDVARGVVGVVKSDVEGKETRGSLFGRRWIVADCVSYDWWLLVWELMGETSEDEDDDESKIEERTKYRKWIVELMEENGIRGLPRPMDALGRKLDARDFWKAIGTSPRHSMAR